MQAADAIPRGAQAPPDLVELAGRTGPFATVYLGTDPHLENAEQRSLQRWRAQRDLLAGQGAPDSCLDAIEELVGPAHLVGESLAVIADANGVLVAHHLDRPRDDDRARWALLPDLVPLLQWHQDQIPYVLVLADHGGADIVAEHPGHRTVRAAAGDGDPERKSSPGGWSQKRFQQRAEEDWAATAREVAAQVTEAAHRVDAQILVLGGDVRSTHLIRDDLAPDVADRAHVIDHGRALDGSDEERQREVRRLVATAVAETSVALLEAFKEERGQHGRAAEGLAATVDALNRSAVEVLLIADIDGPTAWISATPVPIGVDASTASTGSESTPIQVPARDALIRAALGTGASVRVIPASGPVAEGIGALLRWSTPTDDTEGR